MSGAIKAVVDGEMGVNWAADQYGVPRSTLKDRVSAKYGARSGPQPYFVLQRRGRASDLFRQVC